LELQKIIFNILKISSLSFFTIISFFYFKVHIIEKIIVLNVFVKLIFYILFYSILYFLVTLIFRLELSLKVWYNIKKVFFRRR